MSTDLTNSILDASPSSNSSAVEGSVSEIFVAETGIGFEFKEKLAALSNALLESHPSLPVLLRDIHTQLRKDPELTTLLSEEDIGTIVTGLKRQTQTELITAPAKKTAATAGLKKALTGAGSKSIDLF